MLPRRSAVKEIYAVCQNRSRRPVKTVYGKKMVRAVTYRWKSASLPELSHGPKRDFDTFHSQLSMPPCCSGSRRRNPTLPRRYRHLRLSPSRRQYCTEPVQPARSLLLSGWGRATRPEQSRWRALRRRLAHFPSEACALSVRGLRAFQQSVAVVDELRAW